MGTILIRGARVVSAGKPGTRRGRSLATLDVLPIADVAIEDDLIQDVAPRDVSVEQRPLRPLRVGFGAPTVIEAHGRVLMPAFVDCHTHALWAGSRIDEWQMKLRGAAYLDILKAGGGIMSTVRQTRAKPREWLAATLEQRIAQWFLRQGTATVEVKSGYGLSTEHELAMLRAIRDVAATFTPTGRATILPTALIAHALDPDVPAADFIRRTIDETLPAVHAEFPAIPIDAYCEHGAWPLDAALELFERAASLGHPLRVHADQFNSLGMLREAIRLGARSIDHLEASTDADLDTLAASRTFGVILPVCGMHVDGRYARARRFVDAGGALALATNCNPGSAPSASMPLAIALAVRHCGLTPTEAINACTVNAAALLGLHDRGFIAPGARADLILLRHSDERALAHELGGNPVDCVIAGGNVVHGREWVA
jgi:imidazolonepropionase